MQTDIQTKRIYAPPTSEDGFRVLVDRVWPRGMTKEKACLDLWLKDAAPSQVLRNEFCHDPAKWEPFRQHYFAELDANPSAVQTLLDAASKGRLTLLYAARDEHYNQAVALREYLLARPAD